MEKQFHDLLLLGARCRSGATFAPVDQLPPQPLRLENANVAFIASGPNSFQGVYLSLGTSGQFVNLASTFTTFPNSTLSFTNFSSVSYDGTIAAFVGSAAPVSATGPRCPPSARSRPAAPLAPPSPCVPVADTATAVPGGIGAFVAFGTVVVDPGVVV